MADIERLFGPDNQPPSDLQAATQQGIAHGRAFGISFLSRMLDAMPHAPQAEVEHYLKAFVPAALEKDMSGTFPQFHTMEPLKSVGDLVAEALIKYVRVAGGHEPENAPAPTHPQLATQDQEQTSLDQLSPMQLKAYGAGIKLAHDEGFTAIKTAAARARGMNEEEAAFHFRGVAVGIIHDVVFSGRDDRYVDLAAQVDAKLGITGLLTHLMRALAAAPDILNELERERARERFDNPKG